MTYVAQRGVGSTQYTSRVIPVGTSAEWVVQMRLSTSPRRPKAVYLATNAKLTVIPVDDCGAYTSCTDCVRARDPYCAFNNSTMTCVSVSSAPSRQNLVQDVVMGTTSMCPTHILTATGLRVPILCSFQLGLCVVKCECQRNEKVHVWII